LRPLLPRSDVGAGLTNGESDDGGFDEFRLFCPNCRFRTATSAYSASTIARKSDTIPRSATFSAASSYKTDVELQAPRHDRQTQQEDQLAMPSDL
jgi:hypothetical protein